MTRKASLIALVDWCQGGHNEMYLREFSSALTSLGCNVATLSPYHLSFNSPQAFSLHFGPRIRPLTSKSWKRPMELHCLKRDLRHCLKLAEDYFHQSCDLVFFNCLYANHTSYLREAISVLRQPWTGLFLHAKDFLPQSLPCLNNKAAVLEEDVDGILFPDVTNSQVVSCPLARSFRDFAGERPLVSLLGFLQPSKGIMPLITLAMRPDLQNVAFAFAGELCRANFSSEELSLIEKAQRTSTNSRFHFQRIPSEEEYNAAIQVSDVLSAAYMDFPYSSNMLTKAAYFEKPIIVSRGHLMGERVEAYRMGEVVPQNDPSSVLKSIRAITSNYPSWLAEKKPLWKEYREIHSKKSLVKAFAKVLDMQGITHL